MTWRGTGLMLVPVAVVAIGAAVQAMLIVGLALFLVCAAAVVVDSRRAPGRAGLGVERVCNDLLSVGVANRVTLAISARTEGAAAIVHERVPPHMHPSQVRWRVRLPAGVEYTVTPVARGDVTLGPAVVRVIGPWGLGWRQTTVNTQRLVRVDPNLAAIDVYEALARRGQLAELGLRTMRLRTEGSEFERVREAFPDDPLRAINWRATARTGRLMATELIPERAQPLLICLDHGRLMGIGAGELTKLDHAINAALLLVHVALRSGDRAGMLAFSDTVTHTLPPRAGTAQLRRFLDATRPIQPGETEADYDDALAFFSRWQTRRSLVVIFTDVLDPDQGKALIRQCVRLRRRHLPLVVTVRDPALDDAANAVPRSGDDAYARAVAGGLIADRDDTLRLLRGSGVETIDADARTLSPRLVNRYLDLKRRARL
ncbi:MAG TPA: DUF58 domain-containing protein [Candidatus Dormibacteraeota bacterium]|jgi:uncharacterized protein (DUF58 family)|nr:DUF58 domain-containing protein [Candidatus Dormibacteraeota bacterium]